VHLLVLFILICYDARPCEQKNGEKCIALSTFANWIFRNKIPRFAGVMNSVIKDVEIRRNPIDIMELDMTD
jgi:hypothetical protein